MDVLLGAHLREFGQKALVGVYLIHAGQARREALSAACHEVANGLQLLGLCLGLVGSAVDFIERGNQLVGWHVAWLVVAEESLDAGELVGVFATAMAEVGMPGSHLV